MSKAVRAKKDKRSFSKLVPGLIKELRYTPFLIIEERLNRSIKRREIFLGETQSSGSFGLRVKWMAARATWHRVVVVIPRKKGKKPLIFLPLLGVSSFPLLTSSGLGDAGNKHCPFPSEETFALFFLQILYLLITLCVRWIDWVGLNPYLKSVNNLMLSFVS